MSAIPQDVALRMYLAMLAGNEAPGALLELRHKRPQGTMRRGFHDARNVAGIVTEIERLAPIADVYVGVAPRAREDGTANGVARVWCLWADLDGFQALQKLQAFPTPPSIVIHSGSDQCAHAYWSLRRPLTPADAHRANRRLAVTLDADIAATDPARILRPPGTQNFKHDPPREVRCTRLEFVVFTALQVVGDLPDSHHHRQPERRAAVHRAPRPASDDALRAIPAEEYIPALTGREIGRDRKVRCPFHAGGQERTPSLHVYRGDGGWYCWPCAAGGDIYSFGALLYGIEARGESFHELRKRLAEELLGLAA